MVSIEADLYGDEGYDSSDDESQNEIAQGEEKSDEANTTKPSEDKAPEGTSEKAVGDGVSSEGADGGTAQAISGDATSDAREVDVGVSDGGSGAVVKAVDAIDAETEAAGKSMNAGEGDNDNNDDDGGDNDDDDDDDEDDDDDSSDSDDGIEVKLHGEEEVNLTPAASTKKELNVSVKQQQMDAKKSTSEVQGQQTALDINAAGNVDGTNIYDFDLDQSDKPWAKAGAKLKDYFNYGFDEATWKLYCEKQREIRREIHGLKDITIVQRSNHNNNNNSNNNSNKNMPPPHRGMMHHPPDMDPRKGGRLPPPLRGQDRRGGQPPNGRQGAPPPFPVPGDQLAFPNQFGQNFAMHMGGPPPPPNAPFMGGAPPPGSGPMGGPRGRAPPPSDPRDLADNRRGPDDWGGKFGREGGRSARGDREERDRGSIYGRDDRERGRDDRGRDDRGRDRDDRGRDDRGRDDRGRDDRARDRDRDRGGRGDRGGGGRGAKREREVDDRDRDRSDSKRGRR